MIVSRCNVKVLYPKRKIGDTVLSLEYKYSECHSDNEIYYYSSNHLLTKKLEYDFYFEARNRKTNNLEAAMLCYFPNFSDLSKRFGNNALIVNKLSFSNEEALKKIFYYINSIISINKFISEIYILDLDEKQKSILNKIVDLYDMHKMHNQRFFYNSDEAYNMKIYALVIKFYDNYEYEDNRIIKLDSDFSIKQNSFADDVFWVKEENVDWPVPVYKYLDEEDDELAYLNEEYPVGYGSFNKLYYKNKIVGYFWYDLGFDYIENNYVPVAYFYDMYINSKDDSKYKVLEFMLNYIKYNSFKWLGMYFVLYKLNDGKDSLCKFLIDKFNAVDDNDKVYIKYEQK